MLGLSVSISIGAKPALFSTNPSIPATADAVSAVAWLDDSSTDYVKDTIFQYVYNESRAGRWQHISRMWVAKTDLASAYTCIKTGNVATPSTTLAYNAQSGIRITGVNTVNFNYDVSADYADASDYAIGTAFNTFSSPLAGSTWTLLKGKIGSTTALTIGWHPTTLGYQGIINGGTAEGPTGTTLDTCYSSINRLDLDPTSGNSRFRCDDFEGISPYIFGTSPPTSIKQNDNGANSADQTWEMTYMASSAMEWEGFRDNTNLMLAQLAETDHAFSAPLQDGDSLELDNVGTGYFGWVTALTAVPIGDIVVNGYGGKTLKKISTNDNATDKSLNLAIAANPNADSLIIGAGINDITNQYFPPIEDIATIKAYVDDIFAQWNAAANLKHLLIREVTATGGRYDAQNDPAEQSARWQPYTDQINAHIATLVAANPGSYLVAAYTATESSVAAYAGYQEGIIKGVGGDANTSTGGTKGDGDLSVEGVHYKQSGANIVARLGDIQITNSRYYKGGRIQRINKVI